VLPFHLHGDCGIATGDLTGVDQVSLENNLKTELWHEDSAFKLEGSDMKLLLDTAGDIKSMFRKVPLIHRHGIFQVFLLPGPTSAYMIQKHGLISRPKLVEDTTKLSDHSDNLIQSGSIPDLSISNSEETKFIKRLLLTLGAAMKPMTENNPGLQLRIIVGHLDLLGAAPGPQYAWSELNGLLGKLSTRGVASFAARYATRII
jgi:hypothetical protein